MRSIYIAAPWSMKHLAKEAAQKFKAAGWGISSHWFNYEGDGETVHPRLFQEEALRDAEDVSNCDVFVLLNLQRRGEETSGKAVEMGIAIGCGIPVVVVGGWTNVFHFLPDVVMVGTVEEAIMEAENVIREQRPTQREYYSTQV